MNLFVGREVDGLSTASLHSGQMVEHDYITTDGLEALLVKRRDLVNGMRAATARHDYDKLEELDHLYGELNILIQEILSVWPSDYLPPGAEELR